MRPGSRRPRWTSMLSSTDATRTQPAFADPAGALPRPGPAVAAAVATLRGVLEYLLLPLGIVAAWQLVSAAELVPAVAMPSPVRVGRAFVALLGSGELARHVAVSLGRVVAGSLLAAALAIGIGIAIGLSRRLERATDLILEILRPIPPIAWIPLAIVWFGIGEASKLFIIFLG